VDEEANTARPCRCRPQRIARAKARSLSAVIPRRFRDVAWDRPPVAHMPASLVREVRAFADRIERQLDEGRGLSFVGQTGTGKTTLAMLVSKAALAAGRTVAIYSMPRLLTVIRQTYDDGALQRDIDLIDRLVAVDLLHVDDLGAERTNPWVLEQLYSIVNGRYEEQRSIVLTTNITERQELRDQVGERTLSRLSEMCQDIPVYGDDRRGAAV
jgi:DNA replication protein DnaC